MSLLDHYQAVRETAGIVDRTRRGRVAVAGGDRASYLQGLLTNDIAALSVGAGCYATYLTPQGRMIADMRVLEIGDAMLMDVHPSVKDALVDQLTNLVFSEDVQISDWSSAWSQWSVHGPRAAAVVAAVGQQSFDGSDTHASQTAQLAAYAEHRNARWPFHGGALIVARNDEVGVMGFDLYVARELGSTLHASLSAAGAIDVGEDAVEVLRVEAGRPLFPVDMDENTIPLEAGIEDRAISLTKGCYVGQEVIIRILHRGQGRVARKLVGFLFEAGAAGDGIPASGDLLYDGDREIGRLTSAVYSPTLERPIALGYLHRDFIAPGTAVLAAHGEARLSAIVTSLPFVR